MKRLYSLVFWSHLIGGLLALTFIFIMCLTGVLLTYEKQMIAWADRRAAAVQPGTTRLTADQLLERVRASLPNATPAGLSIPSDPAAPAVVGLGRDGVVLVDPWTGALTEASYLRAFMSATTRLHRWLALDGPGRAVGKQLHGVSNVIFVYLCLSGIVLWLTSGAKWDQALWFRRGLGAKAREFNWHNVIGLWAVGPLIVIAASGAVISYAWAGDLVYRWAGEKPPAREERKDEKKDEKPAFALEPLFAKAAGQVQGWTMLSVRLPVPPDARVPLTVDSGWGGQPQRRATLTLDAQAAVVKWEPWEKLTPGRQARVTMRFAHTGEFWGLTGQTLAGIASFGGAILCLTGLSLSWRRWRAWRTADAQRVQIPLV